MAKKIIFEIVEGAYHHRVTISPGDPVTVCEIHIQDEPILESCWFTPLAYGLGVCKRGDTYDYETGCRRALASALRKMQSEAIRAALWAEYLKRFPVSERKAKQADKQNYLTVADLARPVTVTLKGVIGDYSFEGQKHV